MFQGHAQKDARHDLPVRYHLSDAEHSLNYTCLPELRHQRRLPLAHLVFFADVHPQRHELQIGDDVDSLVSTTRVALRVMQA